MFWTVFWACFSAMWVNTGLIAAWFTALRSRDEDIRLHGRDDPNGEDGADLPIGAMIGAFVWGPFGLGTILRNMMVQ